MLFLKGNSEERLARWLRSGDPDALREFYSAYGERLAAICYRYIPNQDDAKDVLQDSLINIVSHIDSFHYRGAGSLQAWAVRITVNESLKYLRRTQRNLFVRLDEEEIGGESVEVDESPDTEDVPAAVLYDMVAGLPPGYRTVFNLYVIEGRSHKEIAESLGIRPDTSASQLHKAKNMLAARIREYRQEHNED